jgi:GNAT superfamily N-acetyltransferase
MILGTMSTDKYVMIKTISFNEILPIWENYLWPNRQSNIDPNSAMCFLGEYDLVNMTTPPTFFAYVIDGEIAGVNSGHMCKEQQYRSRGLYVFEKFRGRGMGTLLLTATIEQAKAENAVLCWSYPKKTSWKSYLAAGFELASDWEGSETSDANAYCKIDL